MTGHTGCTVVLCEAGAVCGLDVRGSASGTRQVDALNISHIVEQVHAIMLCGGSSFGLDAAGGVMRYLEEKGIGFDVGVTKIPIVPTAVIFDLFFGKTGARPTASMGYEACVNAGEVAGEGSVGAGTGATVGKLFDVTRAMKGGVGTSSIFMPDGLVVGALVVVNAFGDIVDNVTGKIIAGARTSAESFGFANTVDCLKRGIVKKQFGLLNTTLGVVATNARFNKREATKVAQMAQGGLIKTDARPCLERYSCAKSMRSSGRRYRHGCMANTGDFQAQGSCSEPVGGQNGIQHSRPSLAAGVRDCVRHGGRRPQD